jgi:peptide/nickel transport system substrate-binding protein
MLRARPDRAPLAEAKTFRWANDGDPTTMDPHARSDLFVTSFDMNMYEALLRRDRNLKLASRRGAALHPRA